MKNPKLLKGIAVTWVTLVVFDALSGSMRAWYLRKMKNPFRTMYAAVRYGRSSVMFALAVLNIMLVLRELGREKLS